MNWNNKSKDIEFSIGKMIGILLNSNQIELKNKSK